MNAMRYLKVLGFFAAMVPASVVASEGEASGTSGRGIGTKFHFPTIAEMRPSTPAGLNIAVLSANRLSLTWTPSQATVSTRQIMRYEIFRNGLKIAQANGTQVSLDYHPSGLAYEFLSVRAVDDRGIASAMSVEILAPNNGINNPLGIEIEAKAWVGGASKFGFPGWRDSGTFYKKATYSRDYVHNWDGYVLHATIDMSVDIGTGEFTIAPNGTYWYWFMEDRHQSTVRMSPEDPFKVEAPVENPRFRTWGIEIPHRSQGEENRYVIVDPKDTSNTVRTISDYFDENSYEYMTWELSNEFTDEELHTNLMKWYEAAKVAASSGPWNSQVRNHDGIVENAPIRGDLIAYRTGNPPDEEVAGGLYRLKVTSLGTHRVRWVEVTAPDGRGAGTAKVFEETVVVTDSSGAYTSTHELAPPDGAATTSIRLLPIEPSVTPATGTISVPSSSLRPWMQQLVLPNQPADLALHVGTGRYATSQITGWWISPVSGPGAVKLVAIDRMIEEVEGFEAAVDAGTPVAFGSNIIERGDGTGFAEYGASKLIAIAVTPGTVVLEFAVQTEFDDVPTKYQIPLQVLPEFSLVTDVDHDGKLVVGSALNGGGDVATSEHPFRFWVNDDNDTGDVKDGDFDDVSQPPGADGHNIGNAGDTHVNGVRDLIDFFPVSLEIKELAGAFPEQGGYSFRLRHDDSALGVVFTSLTRSQAFDYLRGPVTGLTSGFGPALTQTAGDATVTAVTTGGINIGAVAPAFLQRIKPNDGGVILVEVANATAAPLVLELRKGTDVVATAELPLKADPVESMFRYHNLRHLAHGKAIEPGNQGPNYDMPTPSDAPNDPFADVPNRKNVVFVHGYNVNGTEARGSAAEVFKRLYWSGSKAKYYALLWRGDDGQGAGLAPAGADPDFHRNVGHAWQHGPQFRAFLNSVPGTTAIIAHSLGNLVTQVALTTELDPENVVRLHPAPRPATVNSYFAIDAALPLEAVDSTAITDGTTNWMRHPEWKEYDQRLWPTHWHELFTMAPDARKQLTWRDVFRNLDVGTNLFSSGDEVLANPVDDGIPTADVIGSKGRHAWVTQEKLKGGAARSGNLLDSVAIQWLRSRTAGWTKNQGWNVDYDPPRDFKRERRPDETRENNVPTLTLPIKPFFKPFRSDETKDYYIGYLGGRLIAPIGDVNADDEAKKLATYAKCLAEGIPALSYALGSNFAAKFDDVGLGGSADLNGPAFKNGWPSSRSDNEWKHSDCLNVAYEFNFKLYERVVSDAQLK
jgi:hypothetical protein